MQRLWCALAATCLGSLVIAWLDVLPLLGEGVSTGRAVLAAHGLLFVPALLVGALAALFTRILGGPEAGSLRGHARAFAQRAAEPRVALGILLSVPAFFVWLLGVAGVSLRALASGRPPLVIGTECAAFALLSGALAVTAVRAFSRLLANRIGRGIPLGATAIALALGSFTVLFAILVNFGETGGGQHPLSMFGVLRREELDLRPPLLLVALFAFGGLGQSLYGKRPLLAAGTLIVALGLAGTGYRLLDPEVAVAFARGAPLSGPLLKAARSLTDRDGDGVSGRFAGGDCDDTDPSIHPSAVDVPGNGVDEDCSGGDELPRLEEAKEMEPVPQQAAPGTVAVPEPLNVVLITVDTLRADLGYMGYQRPISPNIDALAARSVVFERAYSLASYTGKSLGPMLIGVYPSESHRNWGHFNRFGKEDTFIQERLQQAGVRTVSVQAHWYFAAPYTLERGFDVVNVSASPKHPQGEGDRSVTSEALTDAAIAELDALVKGPSRFFLWVHYLDPHAEYVRHEAYDFGKNQRALYDGEIAYTDAQVGRFLAALSASPAAKNTAIILTSDHGEAFGEHGMVRHGFELWEELIRVPLVVHVPGVESNRVMARRSTIDLVPTLLDLYQLDPSGAQLSGVSLLSDLSPVAGVSPEVRPIFADMPAGPYNDERQAFLKDDLKLILAFGRPIGLYDLAADPGEKKNLLSDKELKNRAFEAFKAFRRELDLVFVRPQ